MDLFRIGSVMMCYFVSFSYDICMNFVIEIYLMEYVDLMELILYFYINVFCIIVGCY